MTCKCKICDKPFSRNWNLTRHLKDIHDLDSNSYFSLEVSDRTKLSNNYLKRIRSQSDIRQFEISPYDFNYYQDPVYNTYRNHHYAMQNNNPFPYFNEYQRENYLFYSEDDMNDNQEVSLPRLWIKIQTRLEMLRNYYYRRNPHLAYTPFLNQYKYQLGVFLVYLGYRCISEKSTYPVDRMLRKYGYLIP